MLARLQRSLPFIPFRYTRQLSTTPRSSFLDGQANDIDDLLIEKSATTPEPGSEPPQETDSLVPPSVSRPSNGLSYAGLPEHKIFLDIPPEQDPLIRYLASSLLRDGRRHTAEKRASRVLLYLHTLTRAEPLPLLRKAIERVMPTVRVARHRHSTKDVQIPIALNEKQQVRYAVKWMLKASDFRGGRTVEERLAREIVQVLSGSSTALRQKETLHQLATVNRGNIPAGRASL
ncbi:ribosomal protein S7 [Fomitiporia mediterranea MF3/22]|uniref:ribosomal protein S7 n=1 Tax=Fomitiporia mediterranea (strain MF3/22) TaxID=694068 RepID=UPI0004407637|nr:ribosomal protein S7 [Fomitiporia mediterranea MF3/22]EJD02360.1 ribosomal protein S7 [Fomitiporia mediterranea MF3/22]